MIKQSSQSYVWSLPGIVRMLIGHIQLCYIIRDSNLLRRVLLAARYITWWNVADSDFGIMGICENMVKIIC